MTCPAPIENCKPYSEYHSIYDNYCEFLVNFSMGADTQIIHFNSILTTFDCGAYIERTRFWFEWWLNLLESIRIDKLKSSFPLQTSEFCAISLLNCSLLNTTPQVQVVIMKLLSSQQFSHVFLSLSRFYLANEYQHFDRDSLLYWLSI
jgi:hypothetical protein